MRCLLVCAVVALAAPAQAQFTVTTAPTDSSLRTVVVRGSGEALGRADRAVLRLAFETEGETVDDALVRHEVEVERIRGLLAGRGIGEDLIFLDRASVGAADEMMMRDPTDETFLVSSQMTVHIDDLALAPRLMAELSTDRDDDALAIQRRNVNVTYTVRDLVPLHQEALREAVQDARTRGELIAEMAGLNLGRVVSVTEDGMDLGSMFGAGMMEAMAGAMGQGGGERRVSATVVVTFAVE